MGHSFTHQPTKNTQFSLYTTSGRGCLRDKDLLKDVVRITNKTLKKINDELVKKVQIKKEDFKDLSDYFLHIKDCGDYNKASKMLEKLNIKTPKNKI